MLGKEMSKEAERKKAGKRKPVNVSSSSLMRILQFAFVSLVGFAGGAISPWVLGWIKRVTVETPSDAFAIANTYIVFTTIIFVGVTVLLAIAGYVIAQQFSAAKSAHESEIIDELIACVGKDEVMGVSIINAILENPDVIAHLNKLMNDKFDELVKEKVVDSESVLQSTLDQTERMRALAERLAKGNAK
jgi:hypothetical protein